MSALSTAEPRKLAQLYLDHALAGRGPEAASTLLDAVARGSLDLHDLFERVLTPSAKRVGELWYQGRITVADEHFVTQLNQSVIAVAGTLRPTPRSSSGRVVLACPEEELHDTGLRMVAQMLNSHGYETSMLGAATPTGDLVEFVRNTAPLAVGLSIASPLTIGSLASAVTALRETDLELPIFVGGRCIDDYPAVSAAVGAQAVGSTREAVSFLDDLRRR